MSFFETSYGDRIELDPRAEKILYPWSNNEAHTKSEIATSFASETAVSSANFGSTKVGRISTDLNTYTLMIDFLDELDLLKQYDTAIDLAGGNGIHAALFRGNYARYVEVADLRDGTDPHFSRKLKRALWKYRIQKLEDRLFNGGLGKHRVKRVQYLDHLNTPTFKNYYNYRFRREPKVDRFVVGDWRKVATGTYDIVLNFECIWLWDHTEVIPKISSLLKPGGIFAMLAPWCWTGRGLGGVGSLLGGQFPFFEQRLSMEDQKRYYEQFKPNLAQYVEAAYQFFDPHRPTTEQYINTALKSGMMVKGTKRLYYKYRNLSLTYRDYFGNKILINPECKTGIVADLGDVMKNIRHFRQDVVLEDLLTKATLFVFQKLA